jgi:hypothetical protein
MKTAKNGKHGKKGSDVLEQLKPAGPLQRKVTKGTKRMEANKNIVLRITAGEAAACYDYLKRRRASAEMDSVAGKVLVGWLEGKF